MSAFGMLTSVCEELGATDTTSAAMSIWSPRNKFLLGSASNQVGIG